MSKTCVCGHEILTSSNGPQPDTCGAPECGAEVARAHLTAQPPSPPPMPDDEDE